MVAFNLQETIYHQLEQRSNVYVAQLDIKGAFDAVWIDGLFYKLQQLGINKRIYRVLRNSYYGLITIVRVGSDTSRPIDVKRSVGQCGVLSRFLCLVFINDIVNNLEVSGHGACVRSTTCGNPTLADDITLVATSPCALQNILDIVYAYDARFKFEKGIEKSCCKTFCHRRLHLPLQVHLGNNILKKAESVMHLGIVLTYDMEVNERVKAQCQMGKQSFHSLLGYGDHPTCLTLTSLYRKITMPSILYGSELWYICH